MGSNYSSNRLRIEPYKQMKMGYTICQFNEFVATLKYESYVKAPPAGGRS
jgi:hypothetical protein